MLVDVYGSLLIASVTKRSAVGPKPRSADWKCKSPSLGSNRMRDFFCFVVFSLVARTKRRSCFSAMTPATAQSIRIQPMRLTRIAKAFDDPDYVFELKHDGFRALVYTEAGACKSRNSNQFKSFVSLKDSLGNIPVKNAILDGEVLNGDDLRSLPLIERKRRLHELVQRSRCHAIVYAQRIEDQGIGLFEEICARDLEGIVAKRANEGFTKTTE
jgi:ATP-dependent DNA ligase